MIQILLMKLAASRRARRVDSGGIFGLQNGLRMGEKTRYEDFSPTGNKGGLCRPSGNLTTSQATVS